MRGCPLRCSLTELLQSASATSAAHDLLRFNICVLMLNPSDL